MDPRSLKLVAETVFDRHTKKLELRERTETQLHIAFNGGLFKASPELILFLNMDWSDSEIVVRDSYDNPVKVDRIALAEKLKSAYQFAMNQWHIEYEELTKIRNSKNV